MRVQRGARKKRRGAATHKAHPVVDLIVRQRDVVLDCRREEKRGGGRGRRERCERRGSGEARHAQMVCHFCRRIFSGRVPICAAISFLRSPTRSSSLHLTRTFLPRRSLAMISIIAAAVGGGGLLPPHCSH